MFAFPLSPLRCELCGGVLKPVRSTPRLGGYSELVTFKCEQCGHIVTKPVEDGKPQGGGGLVNSRS
jgi:hypothetical protein